LKFETRNEKPTIENAQQFCSCLSHTSSVRPMLGTLQS
jgi:hypothetical protein